MDRVDAAIVGAGVVGLACAASLARRGLSVVVLERQAGPARETSSRNSGVIHAGLYYPPGSLKAELCVEGRERLYARCDALGIGHRKTGKLIVATDGEEAAALEALRDRGRANGAGALQMIDGATLAREEPHLRGVLALRSPETGIVDAHGLAASLMGEARSHGADFVWKSEVTALRGSGDGVEVVARSADGDRASVRATRAIVAAGLEADRLAELAGLDVDSLGLRQHPCKGQYFALGPGAPRPRCPLVYPIPRGAGLGIHLTTDLGGRLLAGPDAAYVETIDYTVDPAAATPFAESIARYLPGVRPEHLTPDYAGVRPKLSPEGGGFRDFVLLDGASAGFPGLVLLAGIESPGLTASLALAERVAGLAFGA